ncbi:MAG: hypothetical protein ACKVT0_13115 [Planctomycetaceae bacterium]
MKRIIAYALVVGFVSIGLVGCDEKTSSSKRETTIETPGGTTTITTEKEIKTSDDK